MARRRSNRLVVPNAGRAMDQFKADVMRKEGYEAARPEQVKFEVARSLGIPLDPRYNGQLQTEDAGRIGGQIGGAMVRELVRMAQQSLAAGKGAPAGGPGPGTAGTGGMSTPQFAGRPEQGPQPGYGPRR